MTAAGVMAERSPTAERSADWRRGYSAGVNAGYAEGYAAAGGTRGGITRIVKERERRAITGVSRWTCNRLERSGEFPQRVKLTGSRVGWRLSELQEWVASREAATPKP